MTLPAGVAFEDFKLCPNCYSAQIQFKPSEYLAALEKSVIAPVKLVQNLIDAHPEITRMYTTLSADEMTLDPLFTFNKDLPEISNQHTANRVIECNPSVDFASAPWRIELPQGGVIRGLGSQSVGSWPAPLADLPPNLAIVRTGASGTGKVLEDNASAIKDLLASYNADVDSGVVPTVGSAGGAGRSGTGIAGALDAGPGARSDSGGCNFAHGQAPFGLSAAAAALAAVVLRRRRRS